ncbi:type IV pilin protein [Vibrio sp. S17_S38]|nr:type IV pilin protein [Vibrio sp. S17_S38]
MRQKGMTLIELLIVIAIIGILTSIAYPSYQEHILKSHRATAMADMMKIQIELELDKNKTGVYHFSSIVSGGTCRFCDTEASRYQLEIDDTGSGMDSYIIIAVPVESSAQNKDKCGTLSLNAGSVGTARQDSCW